MESKKVEGLNLINPLLNYFVYNLVYLRTPTIILAHTKPEPIAKGHGMTQNSIKNTNVAPRFNRMFK